MVAGGRLRPAVPPMSEVSVPPELMNVNVFFAYEPGDPGAVDAQCAVACRGAGDHHGVPGVVDLSFVESDGAPDD